MIQQKFYSWDFLVCPCHRKMTCWTLWNIKQVNSQTKEMLLTEFIVWFFVKSQIYPATEEKSMKSLNVMLLSTPLVTENISKYEQDSISSLLNYQRNRCSVLCEGVRTYPPGADGCVTWSDISLKGILALCIKSFKNIYKFWLKKFSFGTTFVVRWWPLCLLGM